MVMKEFDDLKARMMLEKTKLSESVKAVTDEIIHICQPV